MVQKGGVVGSSPNKNPVTKAKMAAHTYGSLTADVKQLINEMPKRFTKNDIIRKLSRDVASNSLDGCLRRLQRQGLIVTVKKGVGRRPNKYQKVNKKDDMFL